MGCPDNIEIKPHLGRQLPHTTNVDKSSICGEFSDCKKYRYTLEFSYNVDTSIRNKSLIIIMKNPSSANVMLADNTIHRVEKYIYHHFNDVLHVKILNLFAIRATKVLDVKNILKVTNELCITGIDNNAHLIEAVRDTDYIIFAWGGPSGIPKNIYDNRINFIVNVIQENIKDKTLIYRINSERGNDKYPFHPCFSSINHSRVLWKNHLTP